MTETPAELRTHVVTSALRAMRATATIESFDGGGTEIVPAAGQWDRVVAALESFGFRPVRRILPDGHPDQRVAAMVVPADQIHP